ncbi:MAG: extracellular solute-binding protein [Ruminococcaceae bacterium]|nr:extracellular solute-binding protein [Oscillospiraceae bacterium]
MNKIKKALALLISVLMIFTLSSCALHFNFPKGEPEETEGEETTADTAVTDPEKPDYVLIENDFTSVVTKHLASIGKADFEGSTVMIATPKASLISEDECGLVMADMVSMRNGLVEDKFNISIYAKSVDADTMFTEVSNAERAGDYYADILMVPQYYVSQYAASGLLFNLCSLPFFDFSAGYNMESGVSVGVGASKGYAIGGYATLDPDTLPAVFFNRDLVKAAGLEDPYSLVRDGQWTWDKFFEYTAAVSAINEARAAEGLDGVYSYGFQNLATSFADIIYVSEGNRFITAGRGVRPTVTANYDESLHAMTTAQTLYNDTNKNYNSLEAINTFANGGSMFLIDRLDTAKLISNSSAVWGVLPLPKGSAEQENYKSLVSSDGLLFAVPAGCNNAETVSRVISGLNAASIGYMNDAYVTDLMYYYLRDNDSVEMVEKICYSAYYDMAYTFGPYDLSIANSTYFAARNVYECNGDMNFYLSRFQIRANNALSRIFP